MTSPIAPADPDVMYQELLRAVPRLAEIYRLLGERVEAVATNGTRILIVGAGGGRELAELAKSKHALEIVAVDPSHRNLALAQDVAEIEGLSDRVTFITGTVDDIQAGDPFPVVLSLLVMHQIKEDTAKAAYLSAIQSRLSDDGLLIHADLCVDAPSDLDSLILDYTSHAVRIGIAQQVTQIELDAISQTPPLSVARLRELFADAHLSPPQEIFRSLWYRCWVARKPPGQHNS